MSNDQDIEQIKVVIEATNRRYEAKAGSVSFAGVDGGIVKITPAGFCWR